MQQGTTNLPVILTAMALMMASMACFSVMNVFIRFVAVDLDTTQIVFLRNLFSVGLLLPWVLYRGSAILKTERMVGHFWRATIGIIGMQTWFYCISILPLNDATALSFTAPIFTFLFAIVFLGERAGWHRSSAMVIGFIGAMVIIRPDPNNLNPDMLLVLFATSMWAIAGMLVKSLTATEPANRIVFYMAFYMMLWSAPIAYFTWVSPTPEHLLYILGIAIASTGAHICLVQAYSRVDVVTLMPFDFFRLVFTAILAYIFFDEVADVWTWAGGAIIVASSAYIARREAWLKQQGRKT